MNHIDCKNYFAIDVFKGFCKRTKDQINADETACADFDKGPKCRHCKHFSMKDDYLGLCNDKAIAYPDMKAGTCKDFSWN